MESRIIKLEQQLHSMALQQQGLEMLLGRLISVAPSLGRDRTKSLIILESAVSSLKDTSKAESRAEVREIELSPPATPPPEPLPSNGGLDGLASTILNIIHGYGQHISPAGGEGASVDWLGKSLFVDRVKAQIAKGEAIRLILPAFPWKSVNKVDKVTGVLPDLGEELALHRLNQMCEDIRTAYTPGGQVCIATDGLVFDDVVGISDEDTWAYSQGLVDMAQEHGLDNVKLLRVMDILGYTGDRTLDKTLYLALAQRCREELLLHYGQTEEEVRQMMKDDQDTLSTYCGFVRFLEADLRFSPVTARSKAISGSQYRKTVKKVAIQMMVRAESFTKLLQARCPDYVRLSIHPSTGAAKLSIPLVVQGSGDFPRSPWHSSVAVAADGSYRTVHKRDVAATHDLVHGGRHGRPYYYREKSPLWDWLDEDADMVCEPRYRNRMVIRPATAGLVGVKTLSLTQLEKLAALREVHTAGPVETQGFACIY